MSFEKITFPEDSVFLVTGGAGFIGSNVAEAILKKGYQVRVLDNLSTGHIENIQPYLEHPDFTFIQEDIRNLDACLKATEGVDYVINLAAWGSVPRSIEMPLLYEEINIRGTLNMMEASRQNGVKRFAYASSSSVYGDSTQLPKKEGHEGKPLSPYALTKKVDEMVEARKRANRLIDMRERAIAYHDTVAPYLDEIRDHIDDLELMVDNQMWPLPKYRELLFIR